MPEIRIHVRLCDGLGLIFVVFDLYYMRAPNGLLWVKTLVVLNFASSKPPLETNYPSFLRECIHEEARQSRGGRSYIGEGA